MRDTLTFLKACMVVVAVLFVVISLDLRGLHVQAQSQVTPAVPVSLVESCGTTVACAGTNLSAVKVVFGSAPLTSGSPSTATLTGLPFTSATTYSCSATDATTATNNLLKIANASGASTVITGPATITDTISYMCVGT